MAEQGLKEITKRERLLRAMMEIVLGSDRLRPEESGI